MKESTQGLIKALERLPVPIVIANPVTARILWVNKHLVRLARASHPDQLLSRNLLDFVQPSQQSIALADLAKVVLGSNPPPVVYQLQTLDGAHAAAHVASVGIMFDGQPAMISLVTDVSEQQRLIRELAESEERYRLLIEAAPDGVAVIVNDEIAFVNPTLVRVLGLEDAKAILGKSLYEFVAPDHRKPVRAARREAVMSGTQSPQREVELLRPDGGLVAAKVVTIPIRWGGEAATQSVLSDFGDVRYL